MEQHKTLFILRHAKSSWNEVGKSDHERSLKARGINDAQAMARRHSRELASLDLIFSSTANRAASTAALFAQELDIPNHKLVLEDSLYAAYESEVERIVKGLSDDLTNVMIVGHNPTFTNFANRYFPNYINNIPTSGLVMLRFKCNSWKNISVDNLAESIFDFPKSEED